MKRFRPSNLSTVVLALLAIGFIRLGLWQIDRAAEKEDRIEAFGTASEYQVLPERPRASDFSRVDLRGTYETRRHLLIDNQIYKSRPGVHVVTPFTTVGGQVVLVNRGWLPLGGDRNDLPAVTTNAGEVALSGHLAPLYRPGVMLGEQVSIKADEWPQLVTFPDLDNIASVMELDLYPLVVYASTSSPQGFDGRDWQPVSMTPAKHRGYALQWFALALTALVAWLVLGFLRGKEKME